MLIIRAKWRLLLIAFIFSCLIVGCTFDQQRQIEHSQKHVSSEVLPAAADVIRIAGVFSIVGSQIQIEWVVTADNGEVWHLINDPRQVFPTPTSAGDLETKFPLLQKLMHHQGVVYGHKVTCPLRRLCLVVDRVEEG